MHVRLHAQGFLLINISVCICACCTQTSVCRTRLPSTSFAPTVRLAQHFNLTVHLRFRLCFYRVFVFNNMFHRDQATHLQVQGRMDREFLSPRMPEQAAGWTILLRKHVVAILLPGFRVYERQKWSVLHWKRTKRPNLLSDGILHKQTEGRATLYHERRHVIDWMQNWRCVCVFQRVDLLTAHARMYDTILARHECNHTVM